MTAFIVNISAHVDRQIASEFGAERMATGHPSFYDFESGPLAAARLAFSKFDEQREAAGPSIRTVTVVDPFFGAVVFTGVLVAETEIEIASALASWLVYSNLTLSPTSDSPCRPCFVDPDTPQRSDLGK